MDDSRILSWLDETESFPTQWASSCSSPRFTHIHKRRKILRALSGNTQQRRCSTKDSPQQNLPISRRRATTSPSQDLHETPKAKRQLITTSTSSLQSSEAAATNSPALGSDGFSGKRKRGTSPTKIASFRFHAIPVRQRQIGEVDDLPESFRRLAQHMQLYGDAFKILPEGFQNVDLGSKARRRKLQLYDRERDKYGSIPRLDQLKHIVSRANSCSTEGYSEPHWNCSVHWPLLEEVLETSSARTRLKMINITTAAIEPRTLVPDLHESEKIPSKKADFAICVDLSDNTKAAIAQASILSLNQTMHEPIRCRPIAISIETKLAGEDLDNGLAQLSTWAGAQITKLKQMLLAAGIPGTEVPPLPLVIVQGSEWNVCFLQSIDDDRARNLWLRISIGNTDTLLGVYQVVAALHYLLWWAKNEYWPWFDFNVLKPRGLSFEDEMETFANESALGKG